MSRKKAPLGTSPGAPKSAIAALSPEVNKDLQLLIASTISISLQPVISKLDLLEKKLDSLQLQMADLQTTTKECKQDISLCQQQITKNEAKIKSHAKRFDSVEKEIILAQMERARFALRLQNVPEKPGDLKDQINTLLAPVANVSKEALNSQIDSVYRITTVFTKKNALPKEVHVKFTNKNLRDVLLKNSNESPVTIGTTRVNILKDVPYLARQKRRKYKILTKLLMAKKIRYTWCTFEGITFVFKDLTFKITTELKLKEFMKKYGTELGHKEPDLADTEPTGARDEEEEEEETAGAAGLAALTAQLSKYSFRERNK